jgi:ornithine cyclodeaminase/alanine dehydrogenase-like protein (mu-crystallin family)
LLSEVVAGKQRGRADRREVTFFSNNEGTGLQFAAVGKVILDSLEELGDAGVHTMPLEWFLQDMPD